MSEKKRKTERSRDTWTDIELRLLNDVITRDELLRRIWTAYQGGDLGALLAALDDVRAVLGPKLEDEECTVAASVAAQTIQTRD
jgi:hypothetical protein